MDKLARFVIASRWWIIIAWIAVAVVGGIAAPKAISALSYDFSLPGQPGYETNQDITARFGGGGGDAPVLLVLSQEKPVEADQVSHAVDGVRQAVPGARVASSLDEPRLRSQQGTTDVILIYPKPVPGPEPYAAALPALERTAEQLTQTGLSAKVTGVDALEADGSDGGSSSPDVLIETLFGGIGALVVLALVFGSFLALMPLFVAIASILSTFLIVWGLTQATPISFIVQYLLALIGLGVAIDYALLVVTRWREERGNGCDNNEAVRRTMTTAGRSVLFSGVTVAVSLAALIALPVPFLRSVGFTGLLIPVMSVVAALTLLPALLLTIGPKLAWPHRRSTDPESASWRFIGKTVVRHRWIASTVAFIALLACASPLLDLHLGQPTNDSLASARVSSASTAIAQINQTDIGSGLTQPVEIVTDSPNAVLTAVHNVPGVAGAAAPESWTQGGLSIVDVWTAQDASTKAGGDAVAAIRTAAEGAGGQVGGVPTQNADFITAVYGNAWWVALVIVAVTFLLLTRALRSIVLPLKALVLNVFSVAAAYGITVLIWQRGVGTDFLFNQQSSGAITVWVPIAVFAFLFGLSMDYEVFLLSRIREEFDGGQTTDEATVRGVARTGRLVTSAALILFLAFIALSRIPNTDVKILATALALGIVIDATIVRGILAPGLVAALGRANWWLPRRRRH